MSRNTDLREIPLESPPRQNKDKKTKHFNPGATMKRGPKDSSRLKELCLRLARFVNRGGKFSYEQVDDLITGLQSGILSLQRKKQEILVTRVQRKAKRNGHKR